jgi:hypothetical protein
MKEEFKKGEIIIYKSKEGPQLEVRLKEETVWLKQDEITKLYSKERSVITRTHLKNGIVNYHGLKPVGFSGWLEQG